MSRFGALKPNIMFVSNKADECQLSEGTLYLLFKAVKFYGQIRQSTVTAFVSICVSERKRAIQSTYYPNANVDFYPVLKR